MIINITITMNIIVVIMERHGSAVAANGTKLKM